MLIVIVKTYLLLGLFVYTWSKANMYAHPKAYPEVGVQRRFLRRI
jgi:hypothetical protein